MLILPLRPERGRASSVCG